MYYCTDTTYFKGHVKDNYNYKSCVQLVKYIEVLSYLLQHDHPIVGKLTAAGLTVILID